MNKLKLSQLKSQVYGVYNANMKEKSSLITNGVMSIITNSDVQHKELIDLIRESNTIAEMSMFDAFSETLIAYGVVENDLK